MGYVRQGDLGPVQTSAVIVLGASKYQVIPPPSPPTPSTVSSTRDWGDPSDGFCLNYQHQHQHQTSSSAEEQLIKEKRLAGGLHVLKTETSALANLNRVYEVDAVARQGFSDAVKTIARQAASIDGKLIVIGVGKSGHIGKKLVATFQSLAIRAVFLHPTEALHGDLGIIGPSDTIMFITYSGQTQEIVSLLPHIDDSLPAIIMTSHMRHETCEIIKHRPNTILLPAPIPEPEKVSFGVSAPSSSTTVALALGDALAITAANEVHASVAAAFAKNHPGGAIGAADSAASSGPQTLGHLSTPWYEITDAGDLDSASLGLQLFRAGYNSKTGWIRIGDELAAPSQIRNLSDADLRRPIGEIPGLMVSRQQMLAMSSETTIRQARDILRDMQVSSSVQEREMEREMIVLGAYSIIAVTKSGCITGVIEIDNLLHHHNHGEEQEFWIAHIDERRGVSIIDETS